MSKLNQPPTLGWNPQLQMPGVEGQVEVTQVDRANLGRLEVSLVFLSLQVVLASVLPVPYPDKFYRSLLGSQV